MPRTMKTVARPIVIGGAGCDCDAEEGYGGEDTEDGGIQVEFKPSEVMRNGNGKRTALDLSTSVQNEVHGRQRSVSERALTLAQSSPQTLLPAGPAQRAGSALASVNAEIAKLRQELINRQSEPSDCADNRKEEYGQTSSTTARNAPNNILDLRQDTIERSSETLLEGGPCQLCSDGTSVASKPAVSTHAMGAPGISRELTERQNAILKELVRRGLIIAAGSSHGPPGLPAQTFTQSREKMTTPNYQANRKAEYQKGCMALTATQPSQDIQTTAKNDLVTQMITLVLGRVPEMKSAVVDLQNGAQDELPCAAMAIQSELQSILDRFGKLQDKRSKNLCQRAAVFLASMAPYLESLSKSNLQEYATKLSLGLSTDP